MAKRSQQDVEILARKATRLLESGMSIAAVAKELKVSPRTVQRWKNRARFLPSRGLGIEEKPHVEVVDTAENQQAVFFNCATRLESLIPVALNELEAILSNPDTRTADRLRACSLIGEWSGLAGGLNGSIRRVLAAGFSVSESDPHS